MDCDELVQLLATHSPDELPAAQRAAAAEHLAACMVCREFHTLDDLPLVVDASPADLHGRPRASRLRANARKSSKGSPVPVGSHGPRRTASRWWKPYASIGAVVVLLAAITVAVRTIGRMHRRLQGRQASPEAGRGTLGPAMREREAEILYERAQGDAESGQWSRAANSMRVLAARYGDTEFYAANMSAIKAFSRRIDEERLKALPNHQPKPAEPKRPPVALYAGPATPKPEKPAAPPVRRPPAPHSDPNEPPRIAAEQNAPEIPEEPNKWVELFDGKTLRGWKRVEKFSGGALQLGDGGGGEVRVVDGRVVLEGGRPVTGMVWTGEFPTMGYEVVLDAMRVAGDQGFGNIVFPVGVSRCSLVVGGSGGRFVGLMVVDGRFARGNPTARWMNFDLGRWYRVRLRVTQTRIQSWIDDEKMTDLPTSGRRLTHWSALSGLTPFGLYAVGTTSALRNIRLRRLRSAEPPPKVAVRKPEPTPTSQTAPKPKIAAPKSPKPQPAPKLPEHRVKGPPLTPKERVALGKRATALVEVSAQGKAQGTGSAFCVHPAGLFVTNRHMLKGRRMHPRPNCTHKLPDVSEATLILRPGEKGEQEVKARLIRDSEEADLALLQVEGKHPPFPALELGTVDGLVETAEVMAFGFPFGKALAVNRGSYPSISVNTGRITSLRRKQGTLDRIQVDVVLNRGNSGGPVIDTRGKVIGVVVSGIVGMGVNFAIPVSKVRQFLHRPEILFTPPVLDRDNQHNPTEFRARAVSALSPKEALTLKLTLRAGNEKPRGLDMRFSEGVHRATAVPVLPRKGPLLLRITATFPDGLVSGVVEDRVFRVGEKQTKLSRVRSVTLRPASEAMSADGDIIRGAVSGLDVVSITVGGRPHRLKLTSATKIEVEAPDEIGSVTCTITAWKGNTELGRLVHPIYVQGVQSSTGLLAYYPFSGNAEDASGNGNHGTVRGPVLTTDRFGNRNRAYDFGGRGYIETPINLDQSADAPAITMTAWIYRAAPSACFVVSSDDGGFDWAFFTVEKGGLYVYTGRSRKGTPLTVGLNKWQFVAAVFIPKKGIVVYTDGSKGTLNEIGYDASDSNLWIGGSPHYGTRMHLFRGKIDDVRIYKRALTQPEIQALYHEGGWPRRPQP